MFTPRHRKYDLRLPRYTSYPTAPHFGPRVSAETVRRWLGELDPAQAVSLYVHVPYCAALCWFCGCNTRITRRYAPVARYLDTLTREIDLVRAALPDGLRASHIHFGGGSPTILSGADLKRIMALLNTIAARTPDAEIAIEIDPRTTDGDYLDAMAACGVPRASIGVQDFNETVQRAINRVQPYECVAAAVAGLRARGVRGINLDLMYGLPHQSVATLTDTIERAVDMRPDRLAVFGYAHVPWMKKHQKLIPDALLPDAAERWAQYETIRDRLAVHGYEAIGLDHFARARDPMAIALKDGTLSRNVQGYTTDRADVLIGLGPSAISGLPRGYAQNSPTPATWKNMVDAGTLPTEKGIALSPDDRLRREIIMTLMSRMAVDIDAVSRTHGRNAAGFRDAFSRIAPLIRDGMVVRDGNRLEMTETGRPLVRAVCAAFDAYLGTGPQRHARAV